MLTTLSVTQITFKHTSLSYCIFSILSPFMLLFVACSHVVDLITVIKGWIFMDSKLQSLFLSFRLETIVSSFHYYVIYIYLYLCCCFYIHFYCVTYLSSHKFIFQVLFCFWGLGYYTVLPHFLLSTTFLYFVLFHPPPHPSLITLLVETQTLPLDSR